jgi:predicted TIM-barrel enzyme
MRRPIPRTEILQRLRGEIEAGRQILATGAGSGLIGRIADRGPVDLIVVYASGKFRQDGLQSIIGALPVANANDVMLELGKDRIMPVVHSTPVIGGVYSQDPTWDTDELLDRMTAIGYSGVINFPTVGRIDGNYRADLEALGLGIQREYDTIRAAAERDMLTLAYVYTPEEAVAMVEAGADVIVGHAGVTRGGEVGITDDRTKSLDAVAETFSGIFDAVRAARSDVIVLSHGGPIITPEDAAEVAQRTGAHGFVGASSTERIPIENALGALYTAFKETR